MQSKHFAIHELVPQYIYSKYRDRAWKFIDSRLIETIDAIKEAFPLGTITINNYFWGGNRNWSGLRTPKSDYYSETSQHSFGRAVDMIFSEYEADHIRKYIKKNPVKFPYVKGLEEGVSWVHLDLRNEDELVTFHPKA